MRFNGNADNVTSIEYWGSGTMYSFGQAFTPGGEWPASKVSDYHVSIDYGAPASRRVDFVRSNPDGPIRGGGNLPLQAPQRNIQVVTIEGNAVTTWIRTEPLDHEPLPNGDSVARWEGNTLVVEGTYFDPETWLTGDGDFHSENMRVIERLTRKGNTLDYEVIIEDPDLFTAPWKPVAGLYGHSNIGSRTLILGEPDEHVREDYPCIDRDSMHKVNNDRF